MAEDFHNALMRRLGVIDDIGRSATNATRSRMRTQGYNSQLSAIQNRLTAGNGVTSSRAAGAPTRVVQQPNGTYKIVKDSQGRVSSQNIYNFGKLLQGMGYRVAENFHKDFGGRVGTHSKNSKHYRQSGGIGHAIDVNWAAGTSKAEQAKLAEIVKLASQYGLRPIFMQPGHYGHAHFDIGW